METESAFSFSILVDGKPLKEYNVDGDTYVEADLHTDTSYVIQDRDDEGYAQNYPVTPFTVGGTFTNQLKIPCYLKLCVDGQQIWMKPFRPCIYQQKFHVNGIRDRREGTLKELLFSLPKITSQKDKSSKLWNEDIGTITLECLEAIEDGYFYTKQMKFTPVEQPKILSDRTIHYQATKQECSLKGGIGISTREGRGICTFDKTDNVTMMTRYKLGKESFGKLIVHYRPRQVLQELGVHDEKWIVAPTETPAVKAQITQEDSISVKKEKLSDDKENAKPKKSKAPESNNTAGVSNNNHKKSSDMQSPQENTEIEEFRIRLQTASGKEKLPDGMKAAIEKDIKKEAIDEYKSSVENVISKIRGLDCSQSSVPNTRKMFCFSPNSVQIKKEQIDGNIKLGRHTPSELGQCLFAEKLGCHSPSDKMTQKLIEPAQIKKEFVDDVQKQFRYIEIDDDVVMLEEVDEDVMWMGDDSCCFIDVEPQDVSIIDVQ